jgi:hypothetical protein
MLSQQWNRLNMLFPLMHKVFHQATPYLTDLVNDDISLGQVTYYQKLNEKKRLCGKPALLWFR